MTFKPKIYILLIFFIFFSFLSTVDASTYSDLQNLIDTGGDTIILDRDYTYDDILDSGDSGVKVSRTVTIDGNGFTVSGANKSRVFNVSADNVTFKNLIITDGYVDINSESYYKGGGVYWSGDNGVIINCTFTNNNAWYGGAVYFSSSNSSILNSTFTRNSALILGGALVLHDLNQSTVKFNSFINNSAGTGGALGISGYQDWPSKVLHNPVNVDFSFNILVNNTDDYNTGVGALYTGDNDNITLNNNWWGSNYPVFKYFTEFAPELAPESWIVMNFTNTTVFPLTPSTVSLTVSLNQVFNSSSNSYSEVFEFIPNRTVFFTSSSGTLTNLESSINSQVSNSFTSTSTGPVNLTAQIDNEIIYLSNTLPDNSFKVLQDLINSPTSTLVLDKDYYYSPITDTYLRDGVIVSKPLNINGNGHTLNALAKVRILNIQADNVNISNINFLNGFSDTGGAILINGENIKIFNSNFSSNFAGLGASIYWEGSNGEVINNIFKNTNNSEAQGVLYFNSEKGLIKNSKFLNNCLSGGALYVGAQYVQVQDSLFINNTGDRGVGISWNGFHGLINNSQFINNTASVSGAGVEVSMGNLTVLNSNFTFNTAGSGAALSVMLFRYNLTLKNSNFISNNVELYGGAVHIFNGATSLIENNKFINNTSNNTGGALLWEYGNNAYIFNNIFTGNTANNTGGAIELEWVTNSRIINNTFTSNGANSNAGALALYGSAYSVLNFNNFTSNSANSSGGAIESVGSENLQINNTLFIKNSAIGDGGAVLWGMDTTMLRGSVYNSSFIDNTAGFGAGIYTYGVRLNIYNSNFTDNQVDSNGGGICFEDNTYCIINNSVFKDNSGKNGGGVWGKLSNSQILNTNFTHNVVSSNGAAVYLDAGTLVTIKDSYFTGNLAGTSGTLYSRVNYLSINNTEFNSNVANSNGGGVFSTGSNLNVNNASFTGNNGSIGGGLVSTGSIFINNTNFTSNSASSYAGAIYISGQSTVSNSNFINNTGNVGGAIYWNGATGTLKDSYFENNSANTGGGIFWNGATGTLNNLTLISNNAPNMASGIYIGGDNTIITNSKFINNTGNVGVGVYWNGLNGKIENSSFTNNQANNYGAGVFWAGINGIINNTNFTSNTASTGAGLCWDNTTGTLLNSHFINNTASNMGGALLWNQENGTSINNTFTNNTASMGGAIYWDGENGKICESSFIENTGNTYGGGIYLGKQVTINNTNFTRNHALEAGGAIYVGTAPLVQIHNSQFQSNIANVYGGGIFWIGAYGTITNSNFTSNTGNMGGALWTGSSQQKVDNCEFINNTASDVSGAIQVNAGNMELKNSKFQNNTARNYGGAISWAAIFGIITNTEFTCNNASIGGAIYWYEIEGTITNSNFTENIADTGSAIFTDGANLRITNTKFKDNQAKSYNLIITNTSDTYTVTLYGGDNILDAIWNNKSNTEIFIDNINPVLGAENSNNGQILYQDEREANQTINILNYENNELILNITKTTDINGSITYTPFVGDNLTFTHYTSILYREISNSTKIKTLNNYINLLRLIEYSLENNITSLTLNKNYTYNSSSDSLYPSTGIVLNKNLTINGNKITLNGGGLVSLFNITNGTIILNNLNIINHKGSAIISSSNLTINNLIFSNNTAILGGAIYFTNGEALINNSKFIENSADNGSAIYSNIDNLKIENSSFINNTAKSYQLEVIRVLDTYTGTLYGGDNLLNAIYNNKSISNVFINGVNPTSQSTKEQNQIVNILIYENNVLLLNITNLTNEEGLVSFTPNIGDTINFTHYEDKEYSFISNSTSILPFNTYSALKELIDYALLNNLEFISLKYDYTFNPSLDASFPITGITITSKLSINGNGHTLNGNNSAFLFVINDDTVISNLSIINHNGINGGAILVNTGDLNLNYTKFINNSATFGGAIYFENQDGIIENSIFINNSANNGSAIYTKSDNLKIENSSFINNTGKSYQLEVIRVLDTYTGTLYGGDNLLNAIYNTKNVNNIFINGTNPVSQSTKEQNQLINILIYENNVLLLNITNLTNNEGVVSFTPNIGDTINFTHYEDNQYSFISNSTSILPFNTYTALKELIDYALLNNLESISLKYDYTFNPSLDASFPSTGITISDKLTINGANHILNGNNSVKLFTISSNNVVLDNLTIINHKTLIGGAISWIGDDGVVNNSKFINNLATYGGALYIEGTNLKLENLEFTSNSADNGSAIYSNSTNLKLENIEFTNNTAKVYLLPIVNFEDTYTGTLYGGDNLLNAIYNNKDSNNIFINNSNPVSQSTKIKGETINILVYSGDTLISNTTQITNEDGVVSTSLNINGTVNFTHYESELYSYISNSSKVIPVNTYTALYNLILDSINNGVYNISLNRNYTYTPGFDDAFPITGIPINKAVTINGNSHTLDGAGLVRLFNIDNSETTNILNLTIKNHKNTNGGAILLTNGNLNIKDVIFINNTGTISGGVLETLNSGNLNISTSVFLNNTSPQGLSIKLAPTTVYTLDYNWWGDNNPQDEIYQSTEILPDNWFIMNFTTKTPIVYQGGILTLNTSINQVYNNLLNVIETTSIQIPSRVLYYTGAYTNTKTITNYDLVNFPTTSIGTFQVNSNIDNEVLNLTLTVLSNPTPPPTPVVTVVITVNDLTVNLDDSINLPVTVYDSNNNPVNTILTVTFNGETYTQNVNGFTAVNLKNPGVTGVYPVTVSCNNTSKTAYITVKEDTNIIIEIPTKTYTTGEEATVNVYIFKNNQPATDGTVTLTLNSKEYQGVVNNGLVSLKVQMPTTQGEYPVNVKYQENTIEEVYTTSFTINSNENIILNLTNTYYLPNTELTIPVTVKTTSGTPVNTGTVSLTINGQTYTGNVENGVGNIKLITPDTGIYPTNIHYTGTQSVDYNTELNIGVIRTKIITEDLTKTYNTGTPFTGYLLREDNTPIIGHHVNIKLTRVSSGASKTYDTVTDYTGLFSLPINLAPGEYTAEITYTGGVIGEWVYVSSANRANIHVLSEEENRTGTILTAEKFNQPYGVGEYFNGTLKDTNGNPLPGQHIKVTLTRLSSGASKTYDTVTDYTGLYKLQINLAPGEYYGNCAYEGILIYAPSNAENTITVY